MNKVTCANGHTYDKDKHISCPYCGVNIDDFNINNKTQPIGSNMNYDNNAYAEAHTQPLNNVMAAGREDSTNKTQALDNHSAEQFESGKTVAMFNETADKKVFEPAVGWVACISESGRGKDFTVMAGRNKIGRGSANDIVINWDEAVSRDNHAEITYDPKGNAFYLTPGTGRGITYLNEEIVLVPSKIKSYDKITIGSTDLIFVALCGDKFTWQN